MYGIRMRFLLGIATITVVSILTFLVQFGGRLDTAYYALISPTAYDRTGVPVQVDENVLGQLGFSVLSYPRQLQDLVIAKEDRWFYYHLGINPYRTLRASVRSMVGMESSGASTITQQLARTLLHTTNDRSFSNRLREMVGAFALELRLSKTEILRRYLDTAYLGERAQGFGYASYRYFGKSITDLSQNELLALVSTLSNPTRLKPFTEANTERSQTLADTVRFPPPVPLTRDNTSSVSGVRFELESLGLPCTETCRTTLDEDLTKRLRGVLARHIEKGAKNGMTHGAIVVIKVPENEVLAVVGSTNPYGGKPGTSINMALETRPVGSTIKPFIYLKGFEKGLRPYTKVDDRELKFDVAGGFAIYPRNYDGQYRGTVLLDEALQNSLNVPTVEVLRYVTLPSFYAYLKNTLGLAPPQPLDSYAYGIALGGLELDLMTLTHLFTALPNTGTLKPLTLGSGLPYTPPSSLLTSPVRIADSAHVALVNAILSDRAGAVDQFGASGSLFLSHNSYAVKTGTSRDYHDSWTVGYTPEFVVGVWVGNVENRPMAHVSGSMGAGAIWHDSMEIMFASSYYTGEKFSADRLVRVPSARGYSWGIPGERSLDHESLLVRSNLILFPHDGDTFLLTDAIHIPLHATEEVTWSGIPTSEHPAHFFTPTNPGTYTIRATTNTGKSESVTITVQSGDGPLRP